ncbi:MAG: hypothetical protein AB7F86_11345 [Bdellovibrionales bacterium]
MNLLVLRSLPFHTELLGFSGVTYWMGGAWLTFFLLIDRRKSLRRRWALASVLFVMLFAPETYEPSVSYLSHFYGFILGVISSLAYYRLNRSPILAQEVWITLPAVEPEV